MCVCECLYGCISYKHIYASSRLGSINKDLGRPSTSVSNLLMTQKAYTEHVIIAIKIYCNWRILFFAMLPLFSALIL